MEKKAIAIQSFSLRNYVQALSLKVADIFKIFIANKSNLQLSTAGI